MSHPNLFRRGMAALFVACPLVAPQPTAAMASPPQDDVLTGRFEVREAAPGWVGIEFRKMPAGDSLFVIVASVFPGSPADRAGIETGDRVLEVNGADANFGLIESMGPRIEPGDPYIFTVLRDSEELEVPVTAEVRPGSADIIVTRMQTQLDTLGKMIAVTLDSLNRSGLEGLPSLKVRRVDEGDGLVTVTVSSADATVTFSEADLRAAVDDWTGADQFARAWVLADSTAVDVPFSRTSTRPVEPAAVTRPRNIEVRVRAEPGAARSARSAEWWEISSSLSPWVEGANRIAGAELHPVGPDLGRYLGVDRGLLVAEVTPGTPASRAGVRSGDVVLSVNGVDVKTVAAAREFLAVPAVAHTVELFRDGEVVELRLRR